jgi:hypothetical protein
MRTHYHGSPNNAMHLSRHLKAAKNFTSLCGQVMASVGRIGQDAYSGQS